jgi:outer membrane protein assembly factor BamB
VTAIDAATGTVEWTRPVGSAVAGAPTAGGPDGVVYVGTVDGNVTALAPTTGGQLWRSRVGGAVTTPAVADGAVYVGSTAGGVVALDAARGRARWTADTVGPVEAAPTVVNGTVYVSATSQTGGAVETFDAANGTAGWTVRTAANVTTSPAVATGTTAAAAGGASGIDPSAATVYATAGRTLLAVNASDGSVRWSRQAAGGAYADPAATAGAVYLAGSEANGETQLSAVAPNGSRLWTYGLGASPSFAAATPAGGTAYVGDGDGRVHAVVEPPRLAVSVPSRSFVTVNRTATFTATVRNTGGLPARGAVSLTVNGSAVANASVVLAPGEATTVPLNWTPATDGPATVTVSTPNASVTQSLDVVVNAFPGGLKGGSSDRPPLDTDADGKYEDMDGDGRFTFVDVIEFVFALQNADYSQDALTQAQLQAVDHDGDGRVTFVDVIDLVFQLPG